MDADALFRLRLRYKDPEGDASKLIETDMVDHGARFDGIGLDFEWSATVALAGLLLRGSPHAGGASWDLVLEVGAGAVGDDPHGRRREFLDPCRAARRLSAR